MTSLLWGWWRMILAQPVSYSEMFLRSDVHSVAALLALAPLAVWWLCLDSAGNSHDDVNIEGLVHKLHSLLSIRYSAAWSPALSIKWRGSVSMARPGCESSDLRCEQKSYSLSSLLGEQSTSQTLSPLHNRLLISTTFNLDWFPVHFSLFRVFLLKVFSIFISPSGLIVSTLLLDFPETILTLKMPIYHCSGVLRAAALLTSWQDPRGWCWVQKQVAGKFHQWNIKHFTC